MNNNLRVFTITCLAMLIISCEKEQTGSSENLEKIYSEQGVPVKSRLVEKSEFVTSLTYTSVLKGISESTQSSLISDTVEDILVEVGDYVEKDQTLVLFPKSNPSANYYQAEAGFKAAEQAFKRIENLYKNNGVSRQSYDDARTQYDVQLANWENVQNLIHVKASISGYVTRINVSPSDNVKPGGELVTISNYDQMTALVWVGDKDIRNIKVGQNVRTIWQGESIEGVVSQVDLAKDPRKNAFAVKVHLDNKSHLIPSGVTVNLSIDTDINTEAIVLHRKEFISVGGESFVYLEKEGYARKQIIESDQNQGMYYQIISGLNEGDRIITESLNLLREDSKVRLMEEPQSLAVIK